MSSLLRSFFDPITLEPLYEGMHYSEDRRPPPIARTFTAGGAAIDKSHIQNHDGRPTDEQRGEEGHRRERRHVCMTVGAAMEVLGGLLVCRDKEAAMKVLGGLLVLLAVLGLLALPAGWG